jgi:sterol desaturase/sphingolipid hydroxylase (fatty acid hydroxylase superfamily)
MIESVIEYFSTIPSLHRTLILVGGITFFWLVESAAPLFRFDYRKWKHAGVNIFFTLTTIVVNFVLAFILVKSADYVSTHKIGLLYLADLPFWMFVVLGLLALDLIGAYLIHFLEHKIKWMWRFHLVHHTDHHIDTTSANRHHPGESVFRFVFTTLAVVLIGTPIGVVMLYQSLSVVLSQFNHANITLPAWIEKSLSWLLVTPGIHRVHHHYRQPYTDSNYGNIFSFWDRLFGTYSMADNTKLTYGLDTYPDKKETYDIVKILKMPFEKYREPIHYDTPEKL